MQPYNLPLLSWLIAIIVLALCLYLIFRKKFYFILLLLALVIFVWPKPYQYVPEGVGLRIRGEGKEQRCIGIDNYKTPKDLQKQIESKICYGWVNPPNDLVDMFQGLRREPIYCPYC